MRRLPELTTVAYDRRGYQGSRGGGVVGPGRPHRRPRSPLRGRRGPAPGRPRGGPRAQPRGRRRRRRGAGRPRRLRRRRGLRAAHAVAGVPPRRGRSGPPWPARGRRPRGGGRALLLPDGEPGGLGPPDRRGPGVAAGRRSGAGGRPAQLAARGPSLRRHRARRAGRLRHGRTDVGGRTIAAACEWLGANVPGAVGLRDRRARSTARTCRTRTTSPRWPAWWWSGRGPGTRDRGWIMGADYADESGSPPSATAPRAGGASAAGTASRRTRPPCPRSSCR